MMTMMKMPADLIKLMPVQVFYTQRELAKAWHCDTRLIGKMREYDMLHPMPIGKSNIYSLPDIIEMFDKYHGYPLRNESDIAFAVQEVRKKEKKIR